MTEIIGVRFKSGGKQYYFNPNGVQVREGQGVIVDTSSGPEYGECVLRNTMVDETALIQPLRPMVRIATDKDRESLAKKREKEENAFRICQEKIAKHGLDMKLVEAEYSFDGSKILFFFTSEGRVDFRALVKDLVGEFHTRIELRQIGVRDEAKLLGGLGICGKPFCCSTFLDEFQPVSIKMAKTQSLSLNPTKISGTCGRLMCCLKYEQNAYEDAVKRMPKGESFVECPDGVGTVSQVNLLRETVKVRLEDSDDAPQAYHNSEIRVVRSGKGKRPEGYVAPPKAELEKLRKVTLKPEDPAVRLSDSIGETLGRLGMGGDGERRRGGQKASSQQKPALQQQKAPQQRPRPAKVEVSEEDEHLPAAKKPNRKRRFYRGKK